MPLRRVCRRLSVVALATVIAACSTGNSPKETKENKSAMNVLSDRPDRRIVQLDNGLVVMAQRLPAAPVASVQCWVKTGSIYERNFNGAGISHFLEHLLSGGSTSKHTEAENNETLGRIGAQMNAATGLDTVNYYINTSADNSPAAIELISDWMQHALITQEEWARERDVIQNEFGMGRGEPGRIFWKLTQQARYATHPARHPTIGYIDEFLKITRDDVYNFYKTMYVPNNMVFVVTGDIDPRKVVEQVKTLWADSKPGKVPAVLFPVERPIESPRTLEGYAAIDRPRLRLAWPGTRLAAPGDYAMDLLGQILGEGELSRLAKTVRDEQQLVADVEAYNMSFSWGEGFFGVDAITTKDKFDAAKAAILKQVERIKAGGVTGDELARAKRKVISAAVFSAQTAQAAASRMAHDFIHTGDPDYLDRYANEVQKVTADEVQAAANRYLQPSRLITISLMPQAKGKVEELKRPESAGNVQPTDTELVNLDNANLVNKMKALKSVTKESATTVDTEPRMVTLSNGLRVIVQKNTRLPIVAMQWYHLGGLLDDEPGREGVANAMMTMMMKGAGNRSADDIARTLEELGATLGTSCGNSTFLSTSQCLKGDWKTVLGLMSDVIQKPTFADAEWAKVRPRLETAIEIQNDEWHTQLRNAMREAYFGKEHPWASNELGKKDVVASLNHDAFAQFHKQHIAASEAVVAVFGDIDEQQVIEEVTRLFGSMPSKPAVPFDAKVHKPVASKLVQVQTAKPLAAVQIAYGPGLARNNPDYAAVQVMTKIVSSFPTGWFEEELRGRGPGLVYAVGAGMMTGAAPGYWAVMFNCQPKDVKEAMTRAIGVVDRIKGQPVDAATLERARTAALVTEALGQQSNSQRASTAALNELYGLGYNSDEKLFNQIRSVTAEQVKAAANTYLQTPVAVVLSHDKVDESTLPPLSGGAAAAPAATKPDSAPATK
jgi:zinc protease